MYEYKCKIVKIVDGDTVDVDIDLGFGVWLKDERVRIMGIDTPESRTSDKVEKVFGTAAKNRLKELLEKDYFLRTFAAKDGEDMKGKFGRILGDFVLDDNRMVTEVLIAEGHAVKYHGQNKADVEKAHLANRNLLMENGIVDPVDVQAAEKKNR
jgi:micrococcal nuclease